MKSFLAVLLFGSLGVVASFYVPALEMWAPLFASLTLIGAFLAWSVRAPASEGLRSGGHKKAA